MNDQTGAVSFEVRDDIGYIRLNSPPVNVLSGQMMDEISALLERAGADESLKALAITAEGRPSPPGQTWVSIVPSRLVR